MDSLARECPPSADGVEFVRFCHRRRRVGWPEMYDEMCAVASRGLFRGWGFDELNDEGIGFSLFELPALAALVRRIVAEEHEQRLAARAVVIEARVSGSEVATKVAFDHQPDRSAGVAAETAAPLRFAGAIVGA